MATDETLCRAETCGLQSDSESESESEEVLVSEYMYACAIRHVPYMSTYVRTRYISPCRRKFKLSVKCMYVFVASAATASVWHED